MPTKSWGNENFKRQKIKVKQSERHDNSVNKDLIRSKVFNF